MSAGSQSIKPCTSRLLAGLLLLCLASCSSQIVNNYSNECVNLPWHGYPMDGTPVRLLQCIGRQGEQWNVKNGQITGVGGSCLDVEGSAPLDGARVIGVTCNGSPSQNWSVADGHIVGIGGKCLDVASGGAGDFVPLIIMTCSGAPSQQWSVH
jgi:Ricin-type beta-trefoil lectin domain